MYPRPLERVRLRLAQDFASDGRRVALAERQELEEIGDRVPFSPAEIRVRDLAALVPDVKQERCDRVGDCGARAAKDMMPVPVHAVHLKLTAELGRIAESYLEEQHAVR